jgi:hypothetical protein
MALFRPDISTGWDGLLSNRYNVEAYSDVQRANATGDATVYTIQYNAEYSDTSGAFNVSTYTYTAQVTGKYQVNATVNMTGIISTHTAGVLKIVTSNRTHDYNFNPYNMADSTGELSVNFSKIVDMDTSDTLTITLTISGGTKVIDIEGASAAGPVVTSLEVVRVA